MGMMSVEASGVGIGGQKTFVTAADVQQQVRGIVATYEATGSGWSGNSHAAFSRAMSSLVEHGGKLGANHGRISEAQGMTQKHTDTADTNSQTEMSSVESSASSINTQINIGT